MMDFYPERNPQDAAARLEYQPLMGLVSRSAP